MKNSEKMKLSENTKLFNDLYNSLNDHFRYRFNDLATFPDNIDDAIRLLKSYHREMKIDTLLFHHHLQTIQDADDIINKY
jgi:hypothetical protein